jgi:hypothetical protein
VSCNKKQKKKEVNMYVKKNQKNGMHFVGNVTPAGLKTYFSVPVKGNKVAQKLSIRMGKTQIDLSGNQVNALLRVIKAAKRLA